MCACIINVPLIKENFNKWIHPIKLMHWSTDHRSSEVPPAPAGWAGWGRSPWIWCKGPGPLPPSSGLSSPDGILALESKTKGKIISDISHHRPSEVTHRHRDACQRDTKAVQFLQPKRKITQTQEVISDKLWEWWFCGLRHAEESHWSSPHLKNQRGFVGCRYAYFWQLVAQGINDEGKMTGDWKCLLHSAAEQI